MKALWFCIVGVFFTGLAMAASEVPEGSYCDSSAGRIVLENGDYSTCYCTRHAVMNLQKLEGCCMWHGGVAQVTPKSIVICRDGAVSELCTRQIPHDNVAIY